MPDREQELQRLRAENARLTQRLAQAEHEIDVREQALREAYDQGFEDGTTGEKQFTQLENRHWHRVEGTA